MVSSGSVNGQPAHWEHAPLMYLERIEDPADVRTLSPDELAELATEIRTFVVEAVARSSRRYPWIFADAWLAMAVSCLVVGGIVTQAVVGVRPWYDPQYVIPLLGMILGNSLTGISLCLDRFMDHLEVRSAEVELKIAFGATRREALAGPLRDAVRTGMIPIINSMAAAGIVSLPGMMTGQILAGSPPLQAVAYQIVVMFMIAAAVALGAMLVVVLAGRHFMGVDATLRLDRLSARKG